MHEIGRCRGRSMKSHTHLGREGTAHHCGIAGRRRVWWQTFARRSANGIPMTGSGIVRDLASRNTERV